MNFLSSLINAADRAAVTEDNMEKLDRSLAFMLTPSLDLSAMPTVELGPPDAGDHVQDELWVDALCAIWRCTVAGTPGTWIQAAPAVILAADLPADAPDKYLVLVADAPWVWKYWNDGGAAWVDL